MDRPVLLPGWVAEPKWDGFRALVRVDAGRHKERNGAEPCINRLQLWGGIAIH